MEVAMGPRGVRINCVCGQDYTYPEVVNTGTHPNDRAAERSRSRAFRAAGVVKNVGGFALGISLLGILFFPIGLLGAGIGIYVLTMLRGPLGRYSGRRAAVAAVVIGAAVFLGEGAAAMSWLKARRMQQIRSVQASVSEDLRALLRAQRLFRATHDTYGTFKEFRFHPPSGRYTYYLGSDDFVAAQREGEKVIDPLPEDLMPAVSENTFTAVAVANLDGDPFLDVWSLTDRGLISQVADDATNSSPQHNGGPGAPGSEEAPEASDEGITDAAVVPASEPEKPEQPQKPETKPSPAKPVVSKSASAKPQPAPKLEPQPKGPVTKPSKPAAPADTGDTADSKLDLQAPAASDNPAAPEVKSIDDLIDGAP